MFTFLYCILIIVQVKEATTNNDLQMILLLFLNFLCVLFAAGNPDTECEVSEKGKLMCKFSKNINSTQSDFSVYFHSDKGHEELLVDCVWVDDELQCLGQKNFVCKKPVSQIAEIIMPVGFVGSPGTYRCIAGLGHGYVKPCRVGKSHKNKTTTYATTKPTKKPTTQQETQEEKNHQKVTESKQGIQPNDKAEDRLPSLVAALGSTSGIIALIVIIFVGFLIYICKKRNRRRNRMCFEMFSFFTPS